MTEKLDYLLLSYHAARGAQRLEPSEREGRHLTNATHIVQHTERTQRDDTYVRNRTEDTPSGGSKGGARDAPPGGANSFNSMQFLGNFGKIVCWRPPPPGELAPPPRGNPGSATAHLSNM